MSTQKLGLREASEALRIPYDVLLRARDAGCGAFRNSKVDTAFLSEWLVDHPEVMVPPDEPEDDEGRTLKEQELQWKIERHKKACRALDLKYESEIGELVPRQQLREALAKAFSPFCATLEKHLDRPTYNKLVKDLREALMEVDKSTTPDTARKSAAAVSNKPLQL